MGLCEGAAAGVGAQAASWAWAAALGRTGGLVLVVVVMLSWAPTGLGTRLGHDAVDGAMVEADARAI